MLRQAAQRIADRVPDDALVLQVLAGEEVFARADWVLAHGPYEPHGEARVTRRTWVQRDPSAREPWPFEDGRFAFAVCAGLAALRDPVGVCSELARVARAGYVELPTVEAELAGGDGRWLCDVADAGLVFVHKPRAVYLDPRVRVGPRRLAGVAPEERVHAMFWEGRLPARERIVDPGELLDELAERLRARFEPSGAEVALTEARRLGGMAGAAAWRRVDGLRGGR